MAERFLHSYGLGALLDDPRFSTNEARVRNAAALDDAVAEAIASRTLAENLDVIDRHELTAIAVQTIADIERDPHWRGRQLVVDAPSGHGSVPMHNVVPRMLGTPGEIRWAGGALGQHNRDVYIGELGIDCDAFARLEDAGVI